MKKKKILKLSAILLGALMCFGFSKVHAIDSVFSGVNITRDNLQEVAQTYAFTSNKYLGISKNRKSGDYYQWNMNTTGEGKTVWKIATYPSTTSNIANYNNLYYCLNATRGFGISDGNMAEGTKDIYNNELDMKISTNKSTISNYAGGKLGNNYNKILWILDNSYIPTESDTYKTSNEYISLMNKAGITIENKAWDLTENDIEVVQQMAVWYFTNPDNVNYGNSELPSLYINGDQLSSIYYETDEYGQQITGAKRQTKANKLYKYFINNADANYSTTTPSLSLNNTNATVSEDGNYYIAGPFSLTKENVTVNGLTVKLNDTTLTDGYLIVSSEDSDTNIANYNNLNTFYIKIAKTKITNNQTTINVIVNGSYDIRTLTFMTDTTDPTNTQPVVLVKNEEKTIDTNKNISINLTEVSVEKVWDDGNDYNKIRPSSIEVQLYKNGTTYGNLITLNATNEWKYRFTNLLEGNIYTVDEVNVPTGYTASVIGNMTNGFTITNTHIPTTAVKVQKVWDNINDVTIPNSVEVQLYKNNEAYRNKVTLNEKNNWTYTWYNLDILTLGGYDVREIDLNGNSIATNGTYVDSKGNKYTVKYEVGADTNNIPYTVITNKYMTPETVSKTVTKVWEDNNNQDGKRAEYGVTLYANGEVCGQEVTLDKDNLTYTWQKLPKYKDGVEIEYTVKETTVPSGYTVSYSEDTFKITNRYTPETTEVSGTKTWEDNNNQDGKRPESITVNLLANGTKVDSKEVTTPWTYSFTNLPKYSNGIEIEYTIDEETVEEYTKIIDGYNITNTYSPETTKVEGTKTWEDNNNQDGKRPESITVNLLANGTKVDSKEVTTPWTYSFTNLPKYSNGIEIEYTIDEETVGEYTKIIDGYNITNTYTPGKISKTVIKSWEDSDNEDAIRPRSVEVQLYKNGTSMGDDYKVILNAENNWTYTWANLDEKENGTNIIYSVEESNVPSGYTVQYSANDYSDTDIITITNTHTVEQPTGKYNVVLRKVDNLGNELSGAKIKINGKEYTVGSAEIAKDVDINSTNSITLEYKLEEVLAPNGYLGLNATKNIKIKLEIEKLDKNYKVKRAYLINENGEQTTDNDLNVELDADTSTINIKVINNPIQKEFDLSLRKFITKVNDNALQREPVVDTSTILATGTATYKHTKEPVSVQVGDIVTYTIRVYNEGETDGYASQITDYLPEWLDFLPDDELNQKYLWEQNLENNRKITTKIASKDSEIGKGIYSNRENKQLLSAYNGGNSLDYIDVEIRCKVNEKAVVKQLITNIAEISKMQDVEGTEVITDRDSTKANVNLPTDTDLPNYKGKESNKSDLADKDYYYKGQEDDDDFEKLIVENFDLALRKFIVKINDTELKNVDGSYTREPVVDTSKLYKKDENNKLITTAIYNHPKNPVQVVNGDIVTYTIRIFNEGTLSGFANEIIENIPEGLEFVEDSSINKTYGWKLKDGKLVTNYLSDADINNLIKAANDSSEGNKVLDYKDVQVQFKVVANPVEYAGNIITNWAEIKEDSNNDIDSTPGNDVKEEDDIDYEPVKLVYFDLSLRKFITNVNGTEINNRVPEVDTSKIGTIGENGKKITTATYTHTKDPIVLETGSVVIYTIRVYNEGTIEGYATEITDNIPEGLEFLPEDKINTDYKWTMIDEEGNITQDVSKAKKITTNYLSKQNDSSQIIDKYDDVNKILSYKDVKVAFKVTEPNTSDRVVINTAEISKDSNEDIDSIPNNNIKGEDDIDNEYVKVETFDLSLKKWVTATKVTYDGKTKTTKTGFNENGAEMAKVDLVGSKLKKTTVKFVYNIKVTNEGEVAGYATELKDYIPSGLKFVAEDNPDWKEQKDGVVTTDKLKDTLLEPGKSATVEIVLTWKNSSTNMGVKTNWAEISVDSGDDIDSTPDNYNKIEDDIDDASVILSIKTGSTTMYITLTLISISILAGGTFLIKKYVINR